MRRRWLYWFLLLLFAAIAAARFAEIEDLVKKMASGRPQWVLCAVLLQIAYYSLLSLVYLASFRAVDLRYRFREMLPLVLASVFVNTSAPSLGAAGVALLADDASRRGEPPAKAAAGSLLALLGDYTGFLGLLIIGLICLATSGAVRPYHVVGSAVMLAMILGFAALLVLSRLASTRVERVLFWVQSLVTWFTRLLRREPKQYGDWAERAAIELRRAAETIASRPRHVAAALIVSLVSHLVSMASIYALFLAFSERIGFGALISGYAVGIVAWVVSPTPQGIGIVEGTMALAYHSMGVSAESATIVSFGFRGLSFWIPMVLGCAMLRVIRAFRVEQRPRTEVWSVRSVALFTGIMGVINTLSAVQPTLMDRLSIVSRLFPLTVRRGGSLTSALAGFALLILSVNLRRRKRAAWFMTVTVLIISIGANLVRGLDYEVASLSFLLAIWLIYLRPNFHARSDPPSVRWGFTVLGAAIIFTIGYGVVGFRVLANYLVPRLGVWASLRETVRILMEAGETDVVARTRSAAYFLASIRVVGAATVGYALLLMLRPVFMRSPSTADERQRASLIAESHGRSSLTRLCLLPDKAYYFTPGGSVVAYVPKSSVAVALGDPIGPENDASAAVCGFLDHCLKNGWTGAFYQTGPDYLDVYRRVGMSVLCIGYEAFVDLESFTLEGRSNKMLRWIANSFGKLGFSAQVFDPPLDGLLMGELKDVSDEWLTTVHGTEKRFSLGWFDDDYIRNSRVIVVLDREGAIVAFANLVPMYQTNAVGVDLMRRRASAPDGTMDFLFLSLFRWAMEKGFASVSLGLSPLARIGESTRDPIMERVLHFIYENVNMFYSFKGLHAYKRKFHPRWSPRFLVYPGLPSLPWVAVAVGRANAGDRFMSVYAREVARQLAKQVAHRKGRNGGSVNRAAGEGGGRAERVEPIQGGVTTAGVPGVPVKTNSTSGSSCEDAGTEGSQ